MAIKQHLLHLRGNKPGALAELKVISRIKRPSTAVRTINCPAQRPTSGKLNVTVCGSLELVGARDVHSCLPRYIQRCMPQLHWAARGKTKAKLP